MTAATRSPVTHAVCSTCWPDPLASRAVGLCGTPANPTPATHECSYQGIGCGCTPCQVCLKLGAVPCSSCLTRAIRLVAEEQALTFGQTMAVAMAVGPLFADAALADSQQRERAVEASIRAGAL